MDFINWLFDEHYIISTLSFPLTSFWWAVYKTKTTRAVICLILWLLTKSSNNGEE